MDIPKTIHYCWFGPKPLGKLQQKCIASWKKYLKEFEFQLWNESNSPMNHPFVKAAYEAQKYAFVADYVRLWALRNEGGIYLDTDMLVLRKFDEKLLLTECFTGYQSEGSVAAGIIGNQPNHPFLVDLVKEYDKLTFQKDLLSEIAIPIIMTELYRKKDYTVKIFQPNYFYPFPFENSVENPASYKEFIKPESYAVHLWDASWIDGMKEYRDGKRWIRRLKDSIRNLFKK